MICVSIIIPSFNKADFISETIDSVISQSYTNWELIIVDDGSTDNTIQIVENYCTHDKRIYLYHRENLPKGGSVCRNQGIKIARGAYIIFLDADDVLETDCIKQRLSKIKVFPQNKFWVFPIGTFCKFKGDHNSFWIPRGTNFLLRFLKHDLPWQTMSVVWEREHIKSLGGFDSDYPRLQDVELHTRALLGKVPFKTFPNNKVDAFYRIDEQRTSQNLEQKIKNQMNGVILYLEKISVLLTTKKEKKSIKGTLFGFVIFLNHNCLVLTNEFELHIKIIKIITEVMDKIYVFKKFDKIFLNIYIKMYKKGLWRLKGYNYLTKKLFTKI